MKKLWIATFAMVMCALAGAQESSYYWHEIDLPESNVSIRGLVAGGGHAPTVVTGTHGTFALWRNRVWKVTHIPGAESLDLRGVAMAFSDRLPAWVVISSGPAEQGQAKIFRSEDDGAHWSVVWSSNRKGVFLDSITMTNEKGYVLGDPIDGHFMLLRTSDSGKTWKEMDVRTMPAALPGEGAFAASNSAIVYYPNVISFVTGGAATSRFFQSRDDGKTWSVIDTAIPAGKPSAGIFSLSLNFDQGIICGGDYQQPEKLGPNVAITLDGGRHWSAVAKQFPYCSSATYLKQAYTIAGPTGAAASGDNGKTWRDLGGKDWNVIGHEPLCGVVTVAGAHGKVARLEHRGATFCF